MIMSTDLGIISVYEKKNQKIIKHLKKIADSLNLETEEKYYDDLFTEVIVPFSLEYYLDHKEDIHKIFERISLETNPLVSTIAFLDDLPREESYIHAIKNKKIPTYPNGEPFYDFSLYLSKEYLGNKSISPKFKKVNIKTTKKGVLLDWHLEKPTSKEMKQFFKYLEQTLSVNE